MSLLEALTMTSGLVYLVLLLWQGRSGWGWTLSLLLAAALWLLVADSVLWLALGLVATTLALWLRGHLEQVKTGLPGEAWIRLDTSREWPQHLTPKVR